MNIIKDLKRFLKKHGMLRAAKIVFAIFVILFFMQILGFVSILEVFRRSDNEFRKDYANHVQQRKKRQKKIDKYFNMVEVENGSQKGQDLKKDKVNNDAESKEKRRKLRKAMQREMFKRQDALLPLQGKTSNEVNLIREGLTYITKCGGFALNTEDGIDAGIAKMEESQPDGCSLEVISGMVDFLSDLDEYEIFDKQAKYYISDEKGANKKSIALFKLAQKFVGELTIGEVLEKVRKVFDIKKLPKQTPSDISDSKSITQMLEDLDAETTSTTNNMSNSVMGEAVQEVYSKLQELSGFLTQGSN